MHTNVHTRTRVLQATTIQCSDVYTTGSARTLIQAQHTVALTRLCTAACPCVRIHIVNRTGTERKTQRQIKRERNRNLTDDYSRTDEETAGQAHNSKHQHRHKHPQHDALATVSDSVSSSSGLVSYLFGRFGDPACGRSSGCNLGKEELGTAAEANGKDSQKPCCRSSGCSRQTESLQPVTAAGMTNPFAVCGTETPNYGLKSRRNAGSSCSPLPHSR